MRHQENFGEAHVSAADGVVAHTVTWLVSDHPGRFAATLLTRRGITHTLTTCSPSLCSD